MAPIRAGKPRDASLFCTSLAAIILVVGAILTWHGTLVPAGFAAVATLALLLVSVAWWRPRWVRPLHRAGMIVATVMGMILGPILLTLVFFLVVTPLALVLRLSGKDLLDLKRSRTPTPWHPSKVTNEFDRMY